MVKVKALCLPWESPTQTSLQERSCYEEHQWASSHHCSAFAIRCCTHSHKIRGIAKLFRAMAKLAGVLELGSPWPTWDSSNGKSLLWDLWVWLRYLRAELQFMAFPSQSPFILHFIDVHVVVVWRFSPPASSHLSLHLSLLIVIIIYWLCYYSCPKASQLARTCCGHWAPTSALCGGLAMQRQGGGSPKWTVAVHWVHRLWGFLGGAGQGQPPTVFCLGPPCLSYLCWAWRFPGEVKLWT